MKIIKIKAKSSSGSSYQVVFEIDENIRVNCSCDAGKIGKLCKHKTGLLSGDHGMLYDLAEVPILDNLMTFIKRSTYSQLNSELETAEKSFDTAKNNVKKVKHSLELALKDGIPITVKK